MDNIIKNKISGYVKIEAKNIYYEIINSEQLNSTDKLLIFLHEGLGSVAQWKDFPVLISNSLKIPALVYDRFGYGKSSKLKNERNETYLEKEAKEDLPILLIKLGFHDRNKILIGHSDGGSIALIYASQFPERTYAVITEAAHTFVEPHTIKGVKPVADLFENGGLKEKLTKYHGENTESMFYGWYNVWSSKKFSKWNIESYLSKIKCSVLAIQGKDDEYGTFKQLESIQTHIGNNRIKILFIDNCAHTPHVHFKEYVSEMMIKFIKDL